jgi:hypothetical protein
VSSASRRQPLGALNPSQGMGGLGTLHPEWKPPNGRCSRAELEESAVDVQGTYNQQQPKKDKLQDPYLCPPPKGIGDVIQSEMWGEAWQLRVHERFKQQLLSFGNLHMIAFPAKEYKRGEGMGRGRYSSQAKIRLLTLHPVIFRNLSHNARI